MSFPQRIIIIQQNNLTSNIVVEIITQILPRFKKYHKTQIKDNKFRRKKEIKNSFLSYIYSLPIKRQRNRNRPLNQPKMKLMFLT